MKISQRELERLLVVKNLLVRRLLRRSCDNAGV
jgi:hypothetical protein